MARASIDKKKKTNQVEPTPESDAEAAVDQLLTGPATEAEEEEEEEDEEGIFDVEKILKHRVKGKKAEFRVRWKGYTAADDTWEPEENLTDFLVKEYYDSIDKASKPDSKRKSSASEKAPTSKSSSSSTSRKNSRKSDTANTSAEQDEDVEMEEAEEEEVQEEPAKSKKKKNATNGSGKRGREAEVEDHSHQDDTVEGETGDESAEEIDIDSNSEEDAKLRKKLLALKDWENLIEAIKTLQREGDGLVVFLKFKPMKDAAGGTKPFVMSFPTPQANIRCPQLLLKFYENSLSFRKNHKNRKTE